MVDPPAAIEDLGEPGAHRRVVGDVELDQTRPSRRAAAAAVFNLSALATRSNGAEHGVARPGEVHGRRPPDARVGTGHDAYLRFERVVGRRGSRHGGSVGQHVRGRPGVGGRVALACSRSPHCSPAASAPPPHSTASAALPTSAYVALTRTGLPTHAAPNLRMHPPRPGDDRDRGRRPARRARRRGPPCRSPSRRRVTASPGFVTLYPGGTARPLASALNTRPDRAVANSAIIAARRRRTIELYENCRAT